MCFWGEPNTDYYYKEEIIPPRRYHRHHHGHRHHGHHHHHHHSPRASYTTAMRESYRASSPRVSGSYQNYGPSYYRPSSGGAVVYEVHPTRYY